MERSGWRMLILGLFILVSVNVIADDNVIRFSSGFEAGGGYNQLFWKTSADDEFYRETNSRTTVYLAPNLRLFARIGSINNFFAHTFFGFTELGGKSGRFKIDPADRYEYEDVMTYNSIELGLMLGYSIDNFNLLVGYKHNIYTSVVLDPPQHFEEEEVYMTVDLPPSSGNLGLRAELQFSETMLSAEIWIGMEKSISTDTYRYSAGDKYHENHFRLIFSMPIFGTAEL